MNSIIGKVLIIHKHTPLTCKTYKYNNAFSSNYRYKLPVLVHLVQGQVPRNLSADSNFNGLLVIRTSDFLSVAIATQTTQKVTTEPSQLAPKHLFEIKCYSSLKFYPHSSQNETWPNTQIERNTTPTNALSISPHLQNQIDAAMQSIRFNDWTDESTADDQRSCSPNDALAGFTSNGGGPISNSNNACTFNDYYRYLDIAAIGNQVLVLYPPSPRPAKPININASCSNKQTPSTSSLSSSSPTGGVMTLKMRQIKRSLTYDRPINKNADSLPIKSSVNNSNQTSSSTSGYDIPKADSSSSLAQARSFSAGSSSGSGNSDASSSCDSTSQHSFSESSIELESSDGNNFEFPLPPLEMLSDLQEDSFEQSIALSNNNSTSNEADKYFGLWEAFSDSQDSPTSLKSEIIENSTSSPSVDDINNNSNEKGNNDNTSTFDNFFESMNGTSTPKTRIGVSKTIQEDERGYLIPSNLSNKLNGVLEGNCDPENVYEIADEIERTDNPARLSKNCDSMNECHSDSDYTYFTYRPYDESMSKSVANKPENGYETVDRNSSMYGDSKKYCEVNNVKTNTNTFDCENKTKQTSKNVQKNPYEVVDNLEMLNIEEKRYSDHDISSSTITTLEERRPTSNFSSNDSDSDYVTSDELMLRGYPNAYGGISNERTSQLSSRSSVVSSHYYISLYDYDVYEVLDEDKMLSNSEHRASTLSSHYEKLCRGNLTSKLSTGYQNVSPKTQAQSVTLSLEPQVSQSSFTLPNRSTVTDNTRQERSDSVIFKEVAMCQELASAPWKDRLRKVSPQQSNISTTTNNALNVANSSNQNTIAGDQNTCKTPTKKIPLIPPTNLKNSTSVNSINAAAITLHCQNGLGRKLSNGKHKSVANLLQQLEQITVVNKKTSDGLNALSEEDFAAVLGAEEPLDALKELCPMISMTDLFKIGMCLKNL